MNMISKLLPALKKKLIIPALSVIVLAVFGGLIMYKVTEAEVVVSQNGEESTVKTRANTVEDLLEELGIEVSKYDELSYGKDDPIKSGMTIKYEKAKKVNVTIDDKTKEYYTTEKTLAEFFKEKEISISQYDQVSLNEQASIKEGMTVKVDRGFQVTLYDGGEEKKVWTTAETVAAFLDEQDIEIGKLDRVEPAKTEDVTKDNSIKITRVEKVTDVVEEKKDFSVKTRKDASLASGTRQIVEAGEEGIIEKKYEVTLENGKEVDRKLISEEVKKDSKQQVVALGTKKPEPKQLASRGDDDVAEVLYMQATGYNWDCATCSGTGYTATGINLRENPKVVAVDPSVIPLGTKVWVEGYGYAVAGDTGGAIKGNRIDLHMSKSAAVSYGIQRVKVKILK
ncbi:ubiquitin-like domain-containing protein [Aquibacillus sp. 3ASR75-11]|uniref:Ubiquitin-like domain-containing protein n=1 Tax=Terrihalobacillus insolitus TaxID=2950438 RepID=A0A9X3WU81_9BACI|nr:G5 and 3D domain-containing protein [Terrihalobacillus insolitus]MDC3414878.1 ubiquitin-like domain-containing protein [Terrihalobacillus insolitus]MDC3426027.1 ubiquitin-like domain-containing protein [Terrihalobacillus insolitus]